MDVGGGGSCWHDRLLSSGLRIQRQAVRGVMGKQRAPRAEHLAARKRRGTLMINYSARGGRRSIIPTVASRAATRAAWPAVDATLW
jgi:hypothetical protein